MNAAMMAYFALIGRYGTAGAGETMPNGLLLALSQFEVGPGGKVLPKPGPALLEFLVLRDGIAHGP